METRIDGREGEAGFSIIEGLIAAALLLIITVGVLPLFSRSMLNNVKGNDSTRQSNGAIDEFERSMSQPFLGGAMQVPDGATEAVEQTVIGLKHLPDNESTVSPTWEPVADVPAADVMLRRTRTLQQYSFDDYASDQVFTTPLPGESESRLVHIKVLDLVFEEPLDPLNINWRTHYTVRAIQAY
jgi:type II secretory pathway pseudopilin PulG